MPRYAETTKLLDRDLPTVSPDSAVKNIEMWQESLGELDSKEAKAISKDLEALKKELTKKEPNGERIFELMGKLGEATVAIAEQATEASSEKVRAIGEALSSSASESAGTAGSADDADMEAEADDKDKESATRTKSGAKKTARA